MACLASYSQYVAELGIKSLILNPNLSSPLYKENTHLCPQFPSVQWKPYQHVGLSLCIFFFLVAHVCGWEERPVSPALLGH